MNRRSKTGTMQHLGIRCVEGCLSVGIQEKCSKVSWSLGLAAKPIRIGLSGLEVAGASESSFAILQVAPCGIRSWYFGPDKGPLQMLYEVRTGPQADGLGCATPEHAQVGLCKEVLAVM